MGRRRIDLVLWIGVALAASALLAAGAFFTHVNANRAVNELKNDLLRTAIVAMAAINEDCVLSLDGDPRDEGTSVYRETKRDLEQIQASNTRVRFAYLVRKVDNGIVFLADSEVATSPIAVKPGTPYPDAPRDIFDVYADNMPRVGGPYKDVWGEWISALVPVADPVRGGISAVLGMDIAADRLRSEYNIYLYGGSLITLSLLSLFLLGVFTIRRGHQERLRLRGEIAKRLITMQALEESEARYRLLFEQMLDGFALHEIVTDGEGKPSDYRFLSVNPAFERMTGLRAGDIIGRTVLEVIPDIELEWIQRYGRVAITGEAIRFDDYSQSLARHFSVVAFRPREGQFACIFTDVTDRLKAQADRDRLFDLSVDLICVARLDGYFAEVNPAWTRVTGWSEEELVSRPWLEFVHPDDLEATLAIGEILVRNEPIVGFENRYRCTDGTYRWLSWNTYPLAGEGIAFAIARDVTTSKSLAKEKAGLEEQLRQSQKMEAVGRLAGGVAHDFNNLLQAIMGYTSLVLDDLEQGSLAHENLEEVNKAAEKATGLVRQLLSFSRRGAQKLEPLDANDVVGGIMKLLRRVLGEDVELVFSPGPGLGTLRADRGQLEQVLMNLCVNARDAMPEGGRILIESANQYLDETYCSIHADAHTGPYVSISVSDTGIGMSREVMEHIFEPFFTTKEVGKGTGLGLATVYGIVRQHGGFITIYSEEGQGAVFRVYLPVTTIDASSTDEVALFAPPPTGSETVLLAEDDPQLRALVEQVLARAGYRVISAKDGMEAVELFTAGAEPIHLAVLDMIMPRMGGKAAAQRIRESSPGFPVLFASGYSPESFGGPAIADKCTAILQKPMSFSDLLHAVRRLLDSNLN